jgi:hypothetical protein
MNLLLKRLRYATLLAIFGFMSLNPGLASAHGVEAVLPPVGRRLACSEPFQPPVLQGMWLHPQDPFHFDFILNQGDGPVSRAEPDGALEQTGIRQQSRKLLKYFLAALTIPQDELWVNLSPDGSDRIVPEAFGRTQMGRDMLAQDYLLKQLTASLMYPEQGVGKAFWEQVYQKIDQRYPQALARDADGFLDLMQAGKVWIVPDTAELYTRGDQVVILNSRLKVMMEREYLQTQAAGGEMSDETSAIVEKIIIPALEKEVNTGRHFAPLRQIYHSMILATWFKRNLAQSLLNQQYADRKKVLGVHIQDPQAARKIFKQYLASFRQGVFDYIREDYDTQTRTVIPRRYFAGGLGFTDFAMRVTRDQAAFRQWTQSLVDGGDTLSRLQGAYQEVLEKEATEQAGTRWRALSDLDTREKTGQTLSLTHRSTGRRQDFEVQAVLRYEIDGGVTDDVLLQAGSGTQGGTYILKYDIQSREAGKVGRLKGDHLVDYRVFVDQDGREILVSRRVEPPARWRDVAFDVKPGHGLDLRSFLKQARSAAGYEHDWARLLYAALAAYGEVVTAGFYSQDRVTQNMWVTVESGTLTLKLGDFGLMLPRTPERSDLHEERVEEILTLFMDHAPEQTGASRWVAPAMKEMKNILDAPSSGSLTALRQYLHIHAVQAEDAAMAVRVDPPGLNDAQIEALIRLPDQAVFPDPLEARMEEYARQQNGHFRGVVQIDGDSDRIVDYLENKMLAHEIGINDVVAIRFAVRVQNRFTRAGILCDRVDVLLGLLSEYRLDEAADFWTEPAYFSSYRLQPHHDLILEYVHLAGNQRGLRLQGQGIAKNRLIHLRAALRQVIPGEKIYLKDVSNIVNAGLLSKYLGAEFLTHEENLDRLAQGEPNQLHTFLEQVNEQARRNVTLSKIELFVDQHDHGHSIREALFEQLDVELSLLEDPSQEDLLSVKETIDFLIGSRELERAIALQPEDRPKVQEEAQRLYMDAYMDDPGMFALVARIPDKAGEGQDSAMAVGPGSLRVPEIPEEAFNALDVLRLSRAVKDMRADLAHPDHEINALLNRSWAGSEEALSFEEHLAFLKRLGREAELTGPTIYKPFGGMDVISPFRLVPEARDVFSVGMQPFGPVPSVVKYLLNIERLDKLIGQFRTFDYEAHYMISRMELGAEGLGALAVFRILAYLEGRIAGVYYFDLDDQGRPRFLDQGQVLDGGKEYHAVVEFVDGQDHETKRFWYLRQNLDYPSKRFKCFIQALDFGSLIIKAPVRQEWDDWLANTVFLPAKRNNARVLHDERHPQITLPHKIWKPGQAPSFLALDPREFFGYSQDYVYYGEARDLKGTEARDAAMTAMPPAFDPAMIEQVDVVQTFLRRYPERYPDEEALVTVLDRYTEGVKGTEARLAKVWADFDFSRLHINQLQGDHRELVEAINALLKAADQDTEARLFAWKLGALAYENTLKKPWLHREPMPLATDKEYQDGLFIDLASGPRAVRYFADLNPRNQYIFVDNRYTIEGFINRAIQEHQAQDYITFRRADLKDPGAVFGDGEMYDHMLFNDIDPYVPDLGPEFMTTAVGKIKPQGRMTVIYSDVHTGPFERWVLPFMGPYADTRAEWSRDYIETTWGRGKDAIEATVFQRQSVSDAAAAPDEAAKGGIDLHPKWLKMGTRGDIPPVQAPVRKDHLLNGNFPGLTPVIYTITPIQINKYGQK